MKKFRALYSLLSNIGLWAANGILKCNGSGVVSAAVSGTDYLTPTGSGAGLTGLSTLYVAHAATNASAYTPGKSTTLYIPGGFQLTIGATVANWPMYIGVGTVTGGHITIQNTSLGTNEASSLYLQRYTLAADTFTLVDSTLITNSLDCSKQFIYIPFTVSLADPTGIYYYDIKWVTPNWGTQPQMRARWSLRAKIALP